MIDNPSYEEIIIQSTQSNGNTRGTDLTAAPYLIPVNIKSKTMNRNSQVNNTSSGVPSFNYQDDVQMEGAYSVVNDDEVGKGLNNHV